MSPRLRAFIRRMTAGERRAQHLGIGEAPAAVRNPSSPYRRMHTPSLHPTAAAGALVGRRLRYRLDLQLLDLVAVAVALDARRAGIHHIADARAR
jgi:hypothetical protein